MTLLIKDRVQEITSSGGTGPILLGTSFIAGYVDIGTAIGNGNTTPYVITDTINNVYEIGVGQYILANTSLLRLQVLASSNANALVNFAIGPKNVFVDVPAAYISLTVRGLNQFASTTSANLASIISDATGTGPLVFANNAVFVTPTLGVATGTSLTLSTALPIASGGTNSTATPTAGGAGYGTGTAYAITAAGTAGQVLTSAGAGTPTWTTPTTGTVTSVGGTGTVNGLTLTGTVTSTGSLTLGGTLALGSLNTLGTAAGLSSTLAIASGGTNSTATPTAGGIGYGTGTAYAITAVGTSGQVLTSAGAGAPTWTSTASININGTVGATTPAAVTGTIITAADQTAFKETTSVFPTIRPTLNLDFVNSKVLDPRITFVRDTTATYYDGQTTAMAEQNLLLYSQLFSNAVWVATTSTLVAAVVAPDTTTTAFSMTATATASTLYQTVTTSNTPYTLSFYIQRVIGTGAINLTLDGTTLTAQTITGSWGRYSVTLTPSAAAHTIGIHIATSGDVINIWGAQLENR